MVWFRLLSSTALLSLSLGSFSPWTNAAAFLHAAKTMELFPGKSVMLNQLLFSGQIPDFLPIPAPAGPSGTPTPTPPPETLSPTQTKTPEAPTPTKKPAAPTPLPLGTTQATSDGNPVYQFPEAAPMNDDTTTYTLLVNKEHSLASNYIPYMVEPAVEIYHKGTNERRYLQPVAAAALEELFAAAKKDGLELVLRCGFRSYSLQRSIYSWALQSTGYYNTARYHAVPGTSEHQTGLAVDLCCEATGYNNNYDFLNTKEYAWLQKNAHHYGWILRYPDKKQSITGYNFEPWHFRYVGVPLATYLNEQKITLEEYYGAPSTTYLQGVPEEFWSSMSEAEYRFMLESVVAYKKDPSGKSQPTPTPKTTATPKTTPTPKLSDLPAPSVPPKAAATPQPSLAPAGHDTSHN